MPKFSIIIPVYNLENYIETCLESIMHQTNQDMEVLVVDDGSTDHSVEKIKKYAENWKDCYNNQDFNGMEKAYKKLEDELDKTLPLENTLKEARNIENIHILIKNKGGDFNLTQEELEFAQKLVV